jgi:deoxyribodipyrimidine photolyase
MFKPKINIIRCDLCVFFQAYENGYVMPNQHSPNLTASPTSMSPHLRFGCLSVRKFYWDIYDLYTKVWRDWGGLVALLLLYI